jgi:anti-sigma factor RsiW
MDDLDGKALWARYKAAEPDALTLAAYAEGRLSAAEAAAVERWLSVNPELTEDVAAARVPAPGADEAATESLVARALPLVSGQVIPFRRRVARWVEITAIAASLALIAYTGFSLGVEHTALAEDSVEVFDSFGAPAGFLEGLQA